MNGLVFGMGLAATALLVHVALWQIRVPRHEWSALVLVFATIGVLGLAVILIFPRYARFGMSTPRLILAGLISAASE